MRVLREWELTGVFVCDGVVTLDMSYACTVPAFFGAHPLVELEASGRGLVGNVFFEFVVGCVGGEESGFVTGGAV